MISHPMRFDTSGSIVTIADDSPRAAAEIAGHVISCRVGERPLAPIYGIPEPTITGINPSVIAGAVAVCEPEVLVKSISVDEANGRIAVAVDVEWENS